MKKKSIILIAIAWLALLWIGLKPAGIFGRIPTMHDYFFEMVAIDFKQPNLCGKISSRAFESPSSLSGDSEPYYLRSECYQLVAIATHNTALCDQVHAAGFFSHSVSKDACQREARHGPRTERKEPPYILPSIMRELGYDETAARTAAMAEADIENGQLSSDRDSLDRYFWDLYRHLLYRGKADERAEFLRRVDTLKP